MIGVGIIGLGFGERVHLAGFRRLEPDVRVVGAYSPSRSIGRRYAAWEELVADPDVQLVSIATPPAAHAGPALAAIAYGKAVLCEKPLAAHLGDAEAMAAAAREAGVPTLVDFEFRGHPAFREARRLLAGEALGAVAEAEVTWRLGTRAGRPLRPSWKDTAAAGGGALLGLGVHSFDYLEWLLGPVDRLRGRLEHAAPEATSDTGFEAELRMLGASHVDACLDVSTAASDPTGHRVRVRGERGELLLENRDVSDYMRGFTLTVEGSPVELPAPDPAEDGRIAPFAELARELGEALAEGRPASPSFEHGLRAQQIAEAVRRSQGDWLDLPMPQV